MADDIEAAYGKRLHRKARTEFRKFWSDYRYWATFVAAFLSPVSLQMVRHGWRSLVSIDETLSNGLVGLVLSLAGTYVIAMRKSAEILDTEQQSKTKTAEIRATRLERLSNGPRILIDIIKCERRECLRFKNVRQETALKVHCEELPDAQLQLVTHPMVLPSVEQGDPQDCWAYMVVKRPNYAKEVIDISNYLAQRDADDLNVFVHFDDLNGVHFRCQFTLERSILGDVLCHAGRCDIIDLTNVKTTSCVLPRTSS